MCSSIWQTGLQKGSKIHFMFYIPQAISAMKNFLENSVLSTTTSERTYMKHESCKAGVCVCVCVCVYVCVCVCLFARNPKRSRGKKLLTFQIHLLLESKKGFLALRVNYQTFKVCLTFTTLQISYTIINKRFHI